MEYVQLGRSTTQVPKIGFGTWQYHGGGGVLRRAHELGAAFVDTAEVYGTEAQVATDLAGLRDDFFIATKVSPQNLHHSDVLAHCAASLKRLATDRIDLYQVHWPLNEKTCCVAMKSKFWLGREMNGKVHCES